MNRRVVILIAFGMLFRPDVESPLARARGDDTASPGASPTGDPAGVGRGTDQSPPRRRTAKPPKKPLPLEVVLGGASTLPAGRISPADLAAALTSRHQIQVMIDDHELRNRGIARAEPFLTIDGGHGQLATKLDETLDLQSGLTWIIDHDVLVITTRKHAAMHAETVVYQLLKPVVAEGLLREIKETIAPREWDAMGGIGSGSAWLNRALVITHSAATHRQIMARHAAQLAKVPPEDKRDPWLGAGRPGLRKIDCRYEMTPLDEVVADLSAKLGVPIELDADALRDAGMLTDAPITFALDDVTPVSALNCLQRASALAWVPQGKRVRITTPAAAQEILHEAAYDVRDMVNAVGGVALNDLIQTHVNAASWDTTGGPGTIRLDAQGCTISQTYGAHEGIARLLSALRRVMHSR